MTAVELFTKAYVEAKREPSDDNLVRLLESLLPFSPPGIEWGLEVASLAGVTYMLDGGKAISVKVSRDEFGPFMQTSVSEIQLTSIPSAAMKKLQDVEGFIQRVVSHLSEWIKRAPANSEQAKLVGAFLEKVRELGIVD